MSPGALASFVGIWPCELQNFVRAGGSNFAAEFFADGFGGLHGAEMAEANVFSFRPG